MTFIEFVMAHGIIIDRPPRLGVWERYPTELHPRKRNGSVKWMGDYGFLQDHAMHTEVILWREDKPTKIDPKVVHAAIKQADEDRRRLQEQAAMKAIMVINQCVIGKHEYLARKGFPDEKGLIWFRERKEYLVIPMRDLQNNLVGMQTITEEGEKRFLYGQKTNGANFVMGRDGVNILCEGYATGLSIREAFRQIKLPARIFVCFSAHNLGTIAGKLEPGLVVADNDKSGTGERTAKSTGWRYWISDTEGEDFNDAHRRAGLFKAAKSLWSLLYPAGGGHVRNAGNLSDTIRARQLAQNGTACA
jgi:putative DNA primase/helicase